MDKTIKTDTKYMVIMKALLVAYILTGILLVLLTLMLLKFHLSEQIISIGVIAIYIATCFLGGMIVGKVTGNRKFLWGIVFGASYFILLTFISLAVNKSLQGDIKDFLTTLVMCVGSGMLGGMIS